MADLQSLLANLLTPVDKQAEMRNKGADMMQLLQGGAGAASAYYSPTRVDSMKGSLGSMFGLDMRDPAQKMREQLAANPPDMGTSAGLSQMAQMAQQAGDTAAAAQFGMQAQMLSTQEAQKVAAEKKETTLVADSRSGLSSLLEGSSLPVARLTAIQNAVNKGTFDGEPDKLIKAAFPEGAEKFKVAGNNIFNIETGAWVTPPEVPTKAGSSAQETSPLDPSDYDSKSWADFTIANNNAQTAADTQAAILLLRPKADEGKEWVVRNGKEVMYPITGSDAAIKMSQQISAANVAGSTSKRYALNTVALIDKMTAALNSGQTDVGLGGIVLGIIPGTNEYNLKSDVDTVLSNLGITQLQEMRAAAANGASGFGQLTATELARLESRIRSLQRGQTKEQFVENLKIIQNEFGSIAGRAKEDWNTDSWLGIPQEAPVSQDSILTPSGNAYTIKVR